MIISKGVDVEDFPNMFSITFVDMKDYFQKFADCVDSNGKPIPITEKLSVAEIIKRLDSVKSDIFWISDTDDSQLLSMIAYINGMQAKYETKTNDDGTITQIPIRYDLFGFNNNGYDDLMIKALLMYYNRFDSTKDLLKKLKNVNDKIISLQSDKSAFYEDKELEMIRKYRLPYATVDLQQVFGLHSATVNVDKETGERQKFGKSLKQTSINLKWYNLLDFVLPPITEEENDMFYRKDIIKYHNYSAEQLNKIITNDFDRYIMPKYIKPMLHYNKNDVFIVCEMARLFPDEIKLRYSITAAFNVNVLCSARANIADKLTTKFYSDYSGLHKSKFEKLRTERHKMSFNKIIFPHIKFETPELQYLLEYMKGVSVYHTSADKSIPMKELTDYLKVSDKPGVFKAEIKFYGTTYTLAAGGIHSVDPPRECISDDVYLYLHHDYTSYYPYIMWKYHIAPEHVHEPSFNKMMEYLILTRVKCKHTPDEEGFVIKGVHNKVGAEALKIVINSIYGKFGSELFWLFDNIAKLKVTINGQLMTMTLVEQLELNGIHVISANTDGIVLKIPRYKFDLYKEITAKWNEVNRMGADYEEYERIVSRDVNNYFDVQVGGKTEFKGALDPRQYMKDLKKGYDMPIIATAVYNYFMYDKPVMETLKEHKDILDFCKTQNVGKQFEVVYDISENGQLKTVHSQRHVRFYVSTKGVVIQKENKTNNSRSRLASGLPVQLLNTLDDKPIEERNIDYKYYKDEAYKIIDPIKLSISPNQKGSRSKGTTSGKKLIKQYSQQYLTLFD